MYNKIILDIIKEWNPLDVPEWVQCSEYVSYVPEIISHSQSYEELHKCIISMLDSMGLVNADIEGTESVVIKIWNILGHESGEL